MNWYLIVFFLANGNWVEADLLEKEGWSPIVQESFQICSKKMKDANERFQKIAEFKNIEVDIKFNCECRENIINPDEINCKKRNWFQKTLDRFFD